VLRLLPPARRRFVRKGSWRRVRSCAPLGFGASVAFVPALAALLFGAISWLAPSSTCRGPCGSVAAGFGAWDVPPPAFALGAVPGESSAGEEDGALFLGASGGGLPFDAPASRVPARRSSRGDGAGPTVPPAPPMEPTAPCPGYESVEAMLAAARST
jgi:hypothetical protein